MKRILTAVVFLASGTLFAQQNPNPAQQATPAQEQKPAVAEPQVAPPPMVAPKPESKVAANEHPLTQLPYTPSLDVAAMDRNADPCVDFYQYTCGGWMASNPIPADQAAWSVYGKLTVDNQRFLWGILDDLA